MEITTVGVDLAKRVFAIHGVDRQGNTVLKKTLRRDQMITFFARLPSCTVAMEACGSAHHWARKLQSLNHQIKLIAPQFVKPYVKGNKHDAADAAAICEAASRPSMRFVAIKSEASQAVLAVHRVRSSFVKARTAQANQLRGLLAEFGITAPLGVNALIDEVKGVIADESNSLPSLMRELTQRLLSHLLALDRQVHEIDLQLRTLAKHSKVCRRLEEVPGIGPITSTALVASVGEQIHQFKNGRQLAAFLGLVPKQCSSGGKERLQGISKRGDVYLRQLLVHGARAVLGHTLRKQERAGSWLSRLALRRNTNVAAIAQANKMARVIWAMLTRNEEFRSDIATASGGNIGPA